jgi:hypothetical protein
MVFWGIWAPPIAPKGTQRPTRRREVWSNVSASKQDPYQINRPIFLGENSFLSCFGAFRAPPNGPKKVQIGLQVGGMYNRMSLHENQINRPVLVGKIV